MEVRTRNGVLITIPASEMPVSVMGAQADGVAVLDVIGCAKAIKDFCENADDCRACAFGYEDGANCIFRDGETPDRWKADEWWGR